MSGVTGPLDPLFAQVRSGILPPHTASNRHEHQSALDALSSIERHVQDMNTALLDIESVASHAVEYGYLHADEWREVLDSARAALPASNGGPDGPAGTPEGVAREKEEE